MSTVTDEMVEAACEAFVAQWGKALLFVDWFSLRADMRSALEAAEAVRVKAPLTMRVDSDPRVSQSAAFMTPAESNLQKVQIPTSALPEGFILWHGGECPVAEGTVVDYVMRDGYVVHESAAKNLRWDHKFRTISDIIAYRIHKPADFRLEAGKFYVTASGERVGPMRHNPGAYGSTYQVSGDWGRWWWPNGEIGLLGSCEPDILALSSNQENNHD